MPQKYGILMRLASELYLNRINFVAAKGKRNIDSITSSECGTNIILIVAVSVLGNTVPPMFHLYLSAKHIKIIFYQMDHQIA